MANNKRKKASIVTASALALALALTGTFAWMSISQTALNEAASELNPGGRLHDDFDGENKDVYVENFTDPNKGGQPILVRVRLDEYMETGPDAGKKKDDATRDATPVIAGTDINDMEHWKTHIPENADDTYHDYWTWKTGGETIFMPTFNKNKDSLEADINGTFAGPDNDPATDEDRYLDYKTYEDGQKLKGDAVYDADSNDVDEVKAGTAVEGTNINTVTDEEHTAKYTQNATVLTMQQWKDQGSPKGKYWVYDADGWAYWAEALQPGEATGLLLDEIKMDQKTPDDNWYYAINVVGQFVTPDNIGNETNQTGFFAANAGEKPSTDAMALLNQAAEIVTTDVVDTITITTVGEATSVKAGESITFSAAVTGNGQQSTNQKVTWAVADNTSADTKIDTTGKLTIGADEKATSLKVTATSEKENTVSKEVTITVVPAKTVTNVTVTAADNTTTVTKGKTLQYTAKVEGTNLETSDEKVTWEVSGGEKSGTQISTSGLLTVATDETAETLTVKATSTLDTTKTGTATVAVKTPSPLGEITVNRIKEIALGSTQTVTIDGVDFYVAAKEGDKALLWTKESIGSQTFGSSNKWKDSTIRTNLNGTWLDDHPILKQAAIETPIKTRTTFDSSDWDTTNDKVFLFSEADVYGTIQEGKEAQANDYTYDNTVLVTAAQKGNSYWLRSPIHAAYGVAFVSFDGKLDTYNYTVNYEVRPALWVNLAS